MLSIVINDCGVLNSKLVIDVIADVLVNKPCPLHKYPGTISVANSLNKLLVPGNANPPRLVTLLVARASTSNPLSIMPRLAVACDPVTIALAPLKFNEPRV